MILIKAMTVLQCKKKQFREAYGSIANISQLLILNVNHQLKLL